MDSLIWAAVGNGRGGQAKQTLCRAGRLAQNGVMRTMRLVRAFAILAVLAVPATANAEESIIKNPGDHPQYRFEAEPHGLIGFGGPFRRHHSDFGAGFRGTVIIVDNGFVPSINNSVGISFGGDIFAGRGTLFLPVAMQWNFWLSPHWSVFGEPGLGFAVESRPAPRRSSPRLHGGGALSLQRQDLADDAHRLPSHLGRRVVLPVSHFFVPRSAFVRTGAPRSRRALQIEIDSSEAASQRAVPSICAVRGV